MLDALNRAERYRELAEGCRRLATIGFSVETRSHYLRGWPSTTACLPTSKSRAHKSTATSRFDSPD
jgi:hypothetical protein